MSELYKLKLKSEQSYVIIILGKLKPVYIMAEDPLQDRNLPEYIAVIICRLIFAQDQNLFC